MRSVEKGYLWKIYLPAFTAIPIPRAVKLTVKIPSLSLDTKFPIICIANKKITIKTISAIQI